MDLCGQAKDRTDGFFDAHRPGPDGVLRFDPAGLVKGWAVERAAVKLRALAGRDFCLNAGGDIILGGQDPWTVGIENPAVPQTLIATLTVTTGAVATSGRAHRGAHILVPQTGVPAAALLAATVTGPSLTWADVYATAAVAMGRNALRWLAGLPGHAGLIVKPGGVALVTPSWPV